jgi:HlyD family secretion protein
MAGVLFWHARPISIRVAKPVEHVVVRVFGLGTVEARIYSRISFQVGAALAELNADHGDRVAKGTVLARLHSTEQEAKVARAKATLLNAEVSVKKADAVLAKAEAVLLQKQEANRRRQSLLGRQVVSEEAAQEAARDEDVARADVAVAKAEAEVARAQIVDAQALVDYESTILGHHVLRTPYDALIVQRHVELGTVVKAGDPIFTLVAPETVWGMAHVDESRAGAIAEGQEAEVRMRSLPHQLFKARVVRIGLESDRVTEERRVYLSCSQCPPRFFLGEQVEVLIKVAELKDVLLVPEASVRAFDGRSALVWSIEEGRLAERKVSIGHRTEDSRLEIVGGLPDGALVALDASNDARPGRKVRLREE